MNVELAPTTLFEFSVSLHQRVQKFAKESLHPPKVPDPGADDFESLARDIAKYQVEAVPGYARLTNARGAPLDRSETLASVHVDLFRLTRIAAHPSSEDTATFVTSGTTGSERGFHPVRDLSTYNQLALLLGKEALFFDAPRAVVVALAQAPTFPPASSLTWMMRLFMENFDGRAVVTDPEGAVFNADSPDRWLVNSAGINADALRRAARVATARAEPLILLSTSFALVGLLEELEGEELFLPPASKIMVTGGFKGRVKEVGALELREALAESFGIPLRNIIGEYGMTELTSQLWETPGGRPGVFWAPPWLRVDAVSPTTGEKLPRGEPGLARFTDLGNIDSAISVTTMDSIEIGEQGQVILHGRTQGAPPRGCSLPYEGLVSGGQR